MTRKAIPDDVQNSVLLKSRRRCCLCFWLSGIDEVVKGQIAHLDQDSSNADENNLVFLCYNHHDEYDGRTSTSKGIREGEVRKWRDELYREMEHRFRSKKSGELLLLFDKARHCYTLPNNLCQMYRVAVRNEGTATVRNVAVRITDFTVILGETKSVWEEFIGLKLGVAINPFGDFSHPATPPKSSVILHPGEEVIFDFVRLHVTPGNYRICHSGYILDSQISRYKQWPRGTIPNGKYLVTISVQGDDLYPVEQEYELSSSEDEISFRLVERST